MSNFFQNLKDEFVLNFIDGNMWKWIVNGLVKTITITFFALVIGIFLGIIVAMIRSTFDKNQEVYKRQGGWKYVLRWSINAIARIYLTVIRGTPVVVQLLIAYLIIFASSRNAVGVAIFAFGLNSGAYVAEIFRGGIMSIDNGQFEAGRSLGFNYAQTMIYIVIPQTVKAVLPTLCNEFIVLLKETSVAGYIEIEDLTKAGERIQGVTFSPLMPLLAVALIYLVLVVILTQLVKILERRLRRNER